LPYAVSKTALVLASRNWAREFAPIRSISIILGGIDTPMLRANPHSKKEIADETLLKRAGTPQEVAETVLYIARNNYITATEIYLDGGSVNR
jgi:pteridine reductase